MRSIALLILLAASIVPLASTVSADCSEAQGPGVRQELVGAGSNGVGVYVEQAETACGDDFAERCRPVDTVAGPTTVPQLRLAGTEIFPETVVDPTTAEHLLSPGGECGPSQVDAGVELAGSDLASNPSDDYGVWFTWRVAQNLLS